MRRRGTMTTLLRLLMFILAISTLEALVPWVEAQSSTLATTVVQNVVKAGSKIRVKIQFKNISDHDINLMSAPWDDKEDHPETVGFRPIMVNAQGKEPPLTKWGKQVFGRTEPSDHLPPNLTLNAVTTFPLHPGQVYTSEVIVSDLYDLSVPGTYMVQVSRHDHDLKHDVKSNFVSITITP
jgi:hypothetical protein